MCFKPVGSSGQRILAIVIKNCAIAEEFIAVTKLVRGNLVKKNKTKPKINAPSKNPKTAPAKRLIDFRNGIKVRTLKKRFKRPKNQPINRQITTNNIIKQIIFAKFSLPPKRKSNLAAKIAYQRLAKRVAKIKPIIPPAA